MKIYAFVWGWMRLAIGLAQMGFALAGAIMLLSNGFCPAMWICFAFASAATILSRFLYGRPKDSTEAAEGGPRQNVRESVRATSSRWGPPPNARFL